MLKSQPDPHLSTQNMKSVVHLIKAVWVFMSVHPNPHKCSDYKLQNLLMLVTLLSSIMNTNIIKDVCTTWCLLKICQWRLWGWDNFVYTILCVWQIQNFMQFKGLKRKGPKCYWIKKQIEHFHIQSLEFYSGYLYSN